MLDDNFANPVSEYFRARKRASTMTTKTTHTPAPWTLEIEEDRASDGSVKGSQILIPEINRLFFDTEWADPDEWELSKANAAHIVRCVNEREELIEVLRYAAALNWEVENKIHAILARAQQEG